ncbi:hypothetical protein P7K49_027590 [Saguinus oedipus]|uniref:Uncharacterized protein n=1 Tax=Saguinus oedipus TaxID=9490 RepID=A0ABQ9U9Y2_SAGOE|nr:hypothetical protein P7K49_027590 [Saguinus oedipus]
MEIRPVASQEIICGSVVLSTPLRPPPLTPKATRTLSSPSLQTDGIAATPVPPPPPPKSKPYEGSQRNSTEVGKPQLATMARECRSWQAASGFPGFVVGRFAHRPVTAVDSWLIPETTRERSFQWEGQTFKQMIKLAPPLPVRREAKAPPPPPPKARKSGIPTSEPVSQ